MSGYSLLQAHVTDDFRSRTFGMLTAAARIVLLLSRVVFAALAAGIGSRGITLAGKTIELLGTRVALFVAGSIVLMAAVASGHTLRRLGRLRSAG